MNTQNQRYIRQMQNRIRQGTVSADGRRRQRFVGADGWLRSMGFTAQAEGGRFFPADGQGQGTIASASTPQSYSQPIVLQISNSSASTNTVNLWGASVYLDNSTYTSTAGNLVISGITISLVSTTQTLNTYRSALQQSIAMPMPIGKPTVQTIAGPEAH